jgi:hypothetical protein
MKRQPPGLPRLQSGRRFRRVPQQVLHDACRREPISPRRPAPFSREWEEGPASRRTYARPMPQSGALSQCRGVSVTLRRPLPSSFITYTSAFCCSPSTMGVSAETM